MFASVAMGMGTDLHGGNTITHYGAPSSVDDHFKASGRGGRSTGHLKIAKLVTG